MSPLPGPLGKEQVLAAMARARLLIVPSLWYENYPMTVVEAMACGTPVLASRLGALPTIVTEGETGALFQPGNAADLARRARELLGDEARLEQMGRAARAHYEAHLAPAANLAALEAIYAAAIRT